MNINILEKMNKVPGGLIIIPLLVAILINTFAPGAQHWRPDHRLI